MAGQEKYIENIYKQVDCVVCLHIENTFSFAEAGSMAFHQLQQMFLVAETLFKIMLMISCRAKDARDLSKQ